VKGIINEDQEVMVNVGDVCLVCSCGVCGHVLGGVGTGAGRDGGTVCRLRF